MANLNRTDIGFQGGQTLALRSESEAYDGLVAALADNGSERWHTFASDDSEYRLDLSQIVYVRREGDEQKVGF